MPQTLRSRIRTSLGHFTTAGAPTRSRTVAVTLCASISVSHGRRSCGHARPERSRGVRATENVTAVPAGVNQLRSRRPLPLLWKPATTARSGAPAASCASPRESWSTSHSLVDGTLSRIVRRHPWPRSTPSSSAAR